MIAEQLPLPIEVNARIRALIDDLESTALREPDAAYEVAELLDDVARYSAAAAKRAGAHHDGADNHQ